MNRRSSGPAHNRLSVTVLVVAKAPVAGLAKTRLTPPATPRQAARIAAASLLDTLDAAGGSRVVVAVTGRLADAERAAELRRALRRTAVLGQRGDGLAHRLANAHADTASVCRGSAVLQVGMDTPQLTPELIADAARRLSTVDAVLGPAEDGGWWALGLHDPRAAGVLRGVPMSRADTGERTLRALRHAGLRVGLLPELSDVDTMSDALRVAASCPGGRFAAAVGEALGAVASQTLGAAASQALAAAASGVDGAVAALAGATAGGGATAFVDATAGGGVATLVGALAELELSRS